MNLLGIKLNKDKVAKIHHSLTVRVASVFGIIGAFCNLHPEYLFDLGNMLMPNHGQIAHDILAFLIPLLGAGGVAIGRTRHSEPLEDRGSSI